MSAEQLALALRELDPKPKRPKYYEYFVDEEEYYEFDDVAAIVCSTAKEKGWLKNEEFKDEFEAKAKSVLSTAMDFVKDDEIGSLMKALDEDNGLDIEDDKFYRTALREITSKRNHTFKTTGPLLQKYVIYRLYCQDKVIDEQSLERLIKNCGLEDQIQNIEIAKDQANVLGTRYKVKQALKIISELIGLNLFPNRSEGPSIFSTLIEKMQVHDETRGNMVADEEWYGQLIEKMYSSDPSEMTETEAVAVFTEYNSITPDLEQERREYYVYSQLVYFRTLEEISGGTALKTLQDFEKLTGRKRRVKVLRQLLSEAKEEGFLRNGARGRNPRTKIEDPDAFYALYQA
ncbi:hypothetical protein ACFL0V_00375 [Nanoarchaeota archaeon]